MKKKKISECEIRASTDKLSVSDFVKYGDRRLAVFAAGCSESVSFVM